nr:hypothetical protein [Pseudochrobactrum asaccharolyticum]
MDKESIYPLIKNAVRVNGTLKEPFTPRDVRRVARGWPYCRYFSYMAYNCTENRPATEALFIRVARGKYKLAD